ncbi:hypothetical protein BH10ACI2_BH10ACI2_00280 [soil metagenome]
MAQEMAKKAAKDKLQIPTRTPQKPGIFDNVGLNRESVVHPVREFIGDRSDIVSDTSTTSPSSPATQGRPTTPTTLGRITTPSSTARPTSQGSQTSGTSAALSSNFYRGENDSITQAIPDGFFPGKAKHVYDVLFLHTRGAIVPTRFVRLSKPKLMKLAGIGSKVTIDKVVEYFKREGIIRVREIAGEHLGNEIEVLTYNEMLAERSGSSGTTRTSLTSPSQNVGPLDRPESSLSSTSTGPINIGTNGTPKTLFKDFLNPDDERGLLVVLEKLTRLTEATTGKGMTRAEWDGFHQVLDMLVDITETASVNANSISVCWKFSLENLRRQILARPRREVTKAKVDPGKPEVESYDGPVEVVIDPLDEIQKAEALTKLRPMFDNRGIEGIEWCEPAYTPSDWEWLTGMLIGDRQELKGINE